MRAEAIKVENLCKYYRAGDEVAKALDGVSFSLPAGEFCAIIGPSGSGKSTLLNMLAGLEPPTRGTIVVAGRHIEKLSENQLVAFRRERVGFIFQSYNLLPTMNAVDNVALPLVFRGVPPKKRTAMAKKYLKLVGLEDQMYHLGNAMSGGQQQRVGIARALVCEPEIIFADEPTGNLDSHTSREILELLRSIVRETHRTLIMVTHDNGIASFADSRIRIIDGKISSIERNDGQPTEGEQG